MKKRLHPGILLIAALFGLAASLPFATTAAAGLNLAFFEVNLTSDRETLTQVFYDVGRGFNQQDSSTVLVNYNDKPATYRFMLPVGTLRALRFDPTDREGTMTISHARIVDQSGRILRTFGPRDFSVVQQIPKFTIEGDTIHMTTVPRANDPITNVALGGPLELPFGWRQLARAVLPIWAAIAFGVLLLAAILDGRAIRAMLSGLIAKATQRPVIALAATAAVAVAIQCHPVIFFGKSFVSPDNAAYLLYDRFPTLPGYQSTDLEDDKGADVGAMLYNHLYYPALERQAIVKNGELPLWNRYNLCGVPLLGQGQTMFGEAFNFLLIATKSAAWAWDVKFVLARWLYALGAGLAIYMLTRHLISAAVLAFAAPYIGFFAYRINHPAQFSLCFAVWVLVAWILVRDARGWKTLGWSLLALIAANWEVLRSGTVKEATMLMACMNLAGFLVVLLAENPWRRRLVKLAAAAAAGLIFALLTAPFWMTLFDTLKASETSYDAPGAIQINPSLFIGFFEDLFYRQLKPNEFHADPSANLVILLGVTWALVRAAEIFRNRGFAAIGFAALGPLALVFSVVPAAFIMKIPFVANIHHIDNTFSCALIVLFTVLAGFGLKALCERVGRPGWGIDCAFAALLAAAPVALYFGSTREAAKSAFFCGYVPSLGLALVTGMIGLAIWAKTRRAGLLGATIAGALALLLWRHGQYVSTPFDPYVFNPKVRADLHARSPAEDRLNALMVEPSRPTGLGYNLFSGYHQMLLWEGINGVDAIRNGSYDRLAVAAGAKKIRWWDSGQWSESDIVALQPIQDLFNVRYYLATHRDPPRDIPGLRFVGSYDLDLYESPTAWPRAFFTDRVIAYPSLPEFVKDVQTGDHRPFAAVAAEDEDRLGMPAVPYGALADRAVQAARDYKLTFNTTSFTVEAGGPGIVVLTETYYPKDFKATVNGRNVPYFRINYAFKGIRIPAAGTYRVSFKYRPHDLDKALMLCAVGLAGLLLGTAFFVRAGRNSSFWRADPKSPA